jgi:hypothetical protein
MNKSALIQRAEALVQRLEKKNRPIEPISDEMNLCLKLFGMVVTHMFDTLPDYEPCEDYVLIESEAILSLGGIEVVCELARTKVQKGNIAEEDKQGCIGVIDYAESLYKHGV